MRRSRAARERSYCEEPPARPPKMPIVSGSSPSPRVTSSYQALSTWSYSWRRAASSGPPVSTEESFVSRSVTL